MTMSDYDNRGCGVLFKNNEKTEDKQPDYRGNITDLDGTEYWLSAWLKTSKAGMKYMSLSIKPKNADARQKNEVTKAAAGGSAPFDDSIPFAPEFR
jgi:uncharacterized protein (DUF736 family)